MTLICVEGTVIASFMGKKSNDLSSELKKIQGIENIKKVCIDMCSSFAKGIREAIPAAEIVSDRFHIVKMLNKDLWKLNTKTFKKLNEKDRNRFSNIRYLLVKDYECLNKWDKRLIRDYLRLNTEIKEIYWLIQDFRQILFKNQRAKQWVISKKLTEWTGKARKYLKKFVKVIEQWWQEVINACTCKESNGIQEGLNNKIKLIKRRGFGYRNCLNFKYRIMAACN
jgi:transposase